MLPYASPYFKDDFFAYPGPVARFKEQRELIARLKALSPWPKARDPGFLLIDGFNVTDLLDSPDVQLRVHRNGQIATNFLH